MAKKIVPILSKAPDWKQRVAMDSADQFSFHEGGINLLNALIARGKGRGDEGTGDPDYYQWSVVT